VMLPNCKAMEWELAHMAPERYGNQGKAKDADNDSAPEVEHALPSELEDMFVAVARRMMAMGIEFKPPIETTASRVEESAPADDEEPK
jgi:hypothetical protein